MRENKLKRKPFLLSVIMVIIMCILLLGLDYFNILSKFNIQVGNLNELSVNAVISVISSIIAGSITLFGVYLTIEDNKKEKHAEAKRLVMPLIKISSAEYDYKYKYIQFDFNFSDESKVRERKDIPDTENITINIKNVGQRELFDLYLGEFDSSFFDEYNNTYSMHPVIYSGDSVNINFSLYEKGSYDSDSREDKFDTLISPISFSCFFKDCLGTCYKQQFTITLFHQVKEGVSLEQKALNASIDRIMIDTAPQEISEDTFNNITENAVQCGGQ